MLVNLSIRKVDGLTKLERGDIHCYESYIECPFNLLPKLLSKDYIYNSFNYIGHRRSNLNICSDANLIILDIDVTTKALSQVFNDIIADGYMCIVSTTSDPSNMYKYRVLLPLDRDVSPKEYRRLVYGLEANGLISDIDMQASHGGQMIYSYKGSFIMSNFDGVALSVDDYILPEAEQQELSTKLDITDMESIIEDFKSYSRATNGNRTRNLLSAGYRLAEMGASDAQLESIILHVNKSFLVPKPVSEVKRRVINFIKQIRRS